MTISDWEILRLTVFVACFAVTISLPLAVAVAWVLARSEFPGKAVVEAIVNLPLVLPPVVTGYLLLVTFGRAGFIGHWLEQTLGWRFVFDWKGAVLASSVVSFPLLVRPIRQAFAAIDGQLLLAAQSLGASRFDAFCSVALPLAVPGLLSGSILAFARSMGEFGATIMIAGNIRGRTQTIPLFVYNQMEVPGGIPRAIPLIILSVLVSFLALIAGEFLNQRDQSRLTRASR